MIENYLKEIADLLQLTHPVTNFAEKTHMSKATISRFYSNKMKVSRSFVKKLNEAYGINYAEIIKEFQNNNQVNEPLAVYNRISNFEKTEILKHLQKLKKDAEDYLNLLENTPKSAHVLEETAKTLEILKKAEKEITNINNN